MILRSLYHSFCRILTVITLFVLIDQHAGAQSLTVQGSPTLSITAGVPGGDLTPVIDAKSNVRFQRAAVTTKITVQTVCPGQKFALSVEAISVGDGIAAPSVSLNDGMLPIDFITGIASGGRRRYSASLQYTASATFSQGNSTELGDDIHTVTYTMVAQ